MDITEGLLNKYSNGLEFKLRMRCGLNNCSEMYNIYNNGDYEGLIIFRNKSYAPNGLDLSINVTSLMLCYVDSGLGTKVMRAVCESAKEIGAEEVNVWFIQKDKSMEETAEGKKKRLTYRKRKKAFKKIGQKLGSKVSYDKENNRVIYML